MTFRHRPVHCAFDGLKAAVLAPRRAVRGRPASFCTHEQITASTGHFAQSPVSRQHETLFRGR